MERTNKISDVLHVGDKIQVKVINVDEQTGKVKVSARELTPKPENYEENKKSNKSFNRHSSNNESNDASIEKRVFRKKEEE